MSAPPVLIAALVLLNIAGYALGVGAGTYLGVLADERLNRRTKSADATPTHALEEAA